MSRNLPPGRRRPRVAAAFTLVEALLSISIAALAGSVLLLGITSSLQTTHEALQQTIAGGMAEQLMDEVVGGRYDDVDDYDGVRRQPPTDPWGIELGKDDGEGGERHPDFQAPPGFFDNWQQRIDVYYVDPSDLTTPLPAGQTRDYRAVEVSIVYVDPQHGTRTLAKLRRVVAYVPPI